MSKPLYNVADRDLLRDITKVQAGFHSPAIVLEGLTEEQATAKPEGLPHSIADLVAHMCYWQEYFLHGAAEGIDSYPEHAEAGWPKIAAGGWSDLRDRFLAVIEKTQQTAMNSPRLQEKLIPDSLHLPFWDRESVGSGLMHGAIHSAHHLGQIITLRQLMKFWPPAAGSMTW